MDQFFRMQTAELFNIFVAADFKFFFQPWIFHPTKQQRIKILQMFNKFAEIERILDKIRLKQNENKAIFEWMTNLYKDQRRRLAKQREKVLPWQNLSLRIEAISHECRLPWVR